MANDINSSSNGINVQFNSNKFFTVIDRKPAAGLPILNSVPMLKPKGSGLIDIVNDFHWKNSGSADEVPAIYATELELDYGTWAQNLARLATLGKDLGTGKKIDAYLQMYATTKTGFWYNFPWLISNGENIRNVSSQWGKAESISDYLAGKNSGDGALSKIGSIAGGIIGAISPGVGFEEIQEYKQTSSQSLTLEFPLYNTVSLEKAFDNYSFVTMFTFQNLKSRTSLMTYIPPKLYTLDSLGLGGIYWPVSYVSNLKIDSIGTTRSIRDFSGYSSQSILIPEAYKVSITFNELLPQSSNIFAGTMGGQKIEVTGPLPELEKTMIGELQQGANKAVSYMGKGAQIASDAIRGGIKKVTE